MPVENYPIVSEALSERRLASFREFLPELENAMQSGEIPNARYTKAKEAFSRIIETAWVETIRKPFAWNREYIQGIDQSEKDMLLELGSPPQTNTLAKAQRQAQAMPDTPSGRALRALMSEVAPLLTLVKDTRSLAVKKTAAPRKQTVTETYRAPAAGGTSVAQVLSELEEITRNARNGITETIAKRHRAIVEAFFKAQEVHAATQGTSRKRFDIYNYVLDISRKAGHRQADPYLRRKLETVLEKRHDLQTGRNIYTMKEDAPDIMRETASREADEICAQYIERNLAKLAPIIEARGDYSGMKILGQSIEPGEMEGRLELRFSGEARFEARSQAVFSYSAHGTPFMRYPLTFHNVVLSNGDPMPQASEKRMNEVFGKDHLTPHPA
jgi:hypothetical protein